MIEESGSPEAGPIGNVTKVRREGGVVKFATKLADGAVIESVCVPMRTKEVGKERLTLCVSTQVGCRMGCAFCATAAMGLRRNLTPDEITGQVRSAYSLGMPPQRVVFMGMGEPLDNFDNFAESVVRLAGESKAGPLLPRAWSRADMLVSTCGFVPGIERLAELKWRKLVPAVSLNAPDDSLRSRIMPVNRKYPMGALREALLRLPLKNGVLMVEYVVLKGFNDAREHAVMLAEYLKPFRACVNLIAWNRVGGAGEFKAPAAAEVERFKRWLNEEGQYARRRIAKGSRIGAGCGQLAGDLRHEA